MENKEVMDEYNEEKILDDILEGYHDYDENDAKTWVESKQYWKSILKNEVNKDPETHRNFKELHEKLVNTVIEFCRKNNLEDIDIFVLRIDGLANSYHYGEWTCGTDSYCSMVRRKVDDNRMPFLENL